MSQDKLELLARDCAPWWRAFFWRRHVRSCAACRSNLEQLREDEKLLEEVRRAVGVCRQSLPLPQDGSHTPKPDREGKRA